MRVRYEGGFTLIELLLVIAVLGILAAIAVPGYVGMQERARKSAMQKVVRSAEPELQMWMHSSVKQGIGASHFELDTNADGKVDADDLPNAALYNAVCAAYCAADGNVSPWDSNKKLWTTTLDRAGTIQCSQLSPTSVELSARDNEGNLLVVRMVHAD